MTATVTYFFSFSSSWFRYLVNSGILGNLPHFGGNLFHPPTPNQKNNIWFHGLKNIRSTAKTAVFHVSSCFFQHPLNGLLMPAGFITARIPELHVRTEETEAISSTNPL